VEQLFVFRIMAVKQGLLAFSRSLPQQLIHCPGEREMEILIAQAVWGVLEEFSRPLPAALGEGRPAPAQEPEIEALPL
jgi:hypothetical protein